MSILESYDSTKETCQQRNLPGYSAGGFFSFPDVSSPILGLRARRPQGSAGVVERKATNDGGADWIVGFPFCPVRDSRHRGFRINPSFAPVPYRIDTG